MVKPAFHFDRNRNSRKLPAYRIGEAAHYLQLPVATLRSWVVGQHYATGSDRRFFRPLIRLPDADSRLLSFMNLVEAHVLAAIRREHEVSLQKVRKALSYLQQQFPSPHPLADQRFETDGLDLFIEKFGQLINISRAGQLAVRRLLHAHLRRIERDSRGLPLRLYPFTRRDPANAPKLVVIDPQVSFGRPVLVGSGIATAIIAERYKAGDSIEDLVKDYNRPQPEIEEAIRCELQLQAA